MDQIRTELRFACRRLRMAPVFTLFSVIALGLGIGATTAIYSVVHAAILRPLDIKDVERVVNIYHTDPTPGLDLSSLALSWPDYQDLRVTQKSFSEIAAWSRFRHAVTGSGGSEVIFGEMVSGTYFSLLGVEVALGRALGPDDDRPGSVPVVVLGDRFWRERFEADPRVVGKAVKIGGHAFEVIGVAPASFRGVDMPNVIPSAAWVPLASAPLLRGARGTLNRSDFSDRESRWLFVKARMKPGVTATQAGAEVTAIGRNLDAAFPLGRNLPAPRRVGPSNRRAFHVIPTADVRVHESVHRVAGPLALAVMAAVGLVLLVACTNLANLTLARGASRRHELAVRLALGASRFRLVREQLVESAVVASLGGVAAFAIAKVLMVSILSSAVPAAPGIALQLAPSLNPSVVAVATLAPCLAVLIFGLGPAIHLTRGGRMRGALAADSPTVAVPRFRGRHNLIAAQVTVSVVLVALAAVSLERVAQAARHDWGMDLDRLALARIDFNLKNEDEANARRSLDALLERTNRQPGVEVAAFSSGLPAGVSPPGVWLSTPDRPFIDERVPGQHADLIAGTKAIFTTFCLRVSRGRAFDERDTKDSLAVALLSESAAQELFGSSDVVGRQLLTRGARWLGEESVLRTVIGVVGDVRRFGRRQKGVLYLPFAQHYEPAVTLVARTAGDPATLVGPLRQLVAQVDPELAIIEAGTGSALGGGANVVLKITAGVAGLLGTLALVLSMAGLYGVLTYLVAGRTREIGVRMALGAGPARVLRGILWDGTRPVLSGLVIGFVAALIARQSFLPVFDRLLPAFDAGVLVTLPAFFIGAALLASYLPARRAARVDPNTALRHL